MQFIVDSKIFSRLLKLYKIDKALYIQVTQQCIRIKNIDFKEGLGLLQGVIKVSNPNLKPFVFKVESSDIIPKLESFKNQVLISVNQIENTLKLEDPEDSSYRYVVRCEVGQRIKKYFNLELVSPFEKPELSYTMSSEDTINCFKVILAVENVIFFRFYKCNTYYAQLVSKKITSVGIETLDDKIIKEYAYNLESQVKELQVYFTPVFSNFFKESSLIKYKIYNEYFLIESAELDSSSFEFKIYIPIKEI